jgi:hypothetical protein
VAALRRSCGAKARGTRGTRQRSEAENINSVYCKPRILLCSVIAWLDTTLQCYCLGTLVSCSPAT